MFHLFIPRLGFNPATDVQVLCPITRGVIGTRNLNTVLQQLINPPSPDKVEITKGGNLYYMMLSRNLFYTGLTRAKRLAIVIGSKKAISLAVRTTDDQQRYTRLQHRLVTTNG